eukprot:5907107-Ditylum_brightwellii.AAC.1
MRGEGNGPTTAGKSQKQQGGAPLLFLNCDFVSYHTTERFQWEINMQLLVKGESQLMPPTKLETKSKHY